MDKAVPYSDDSCFVLTEQAVEYLTRAVHKGVDERQYGGAKRALQALEYLHPARERLRPRNDRD